jgi:CheY-like chemotaxis protein
LRKGVKILIVDDESMIRDAMKHLLEHCGCEVEAFDNGQAVLARLAQSKFDVVMTDFSMPSMQGDQLAARIREQWPDQRIVMVTALVEEYKVFGQPWGTVNALLFKPFTFKELQETIEGVLAVDTAADSSAIPPLPEGLPAQKFRPPPEP